MGSFTITDVAICETVHSGGRLFAFPITKRKELTVTIELKNEYLTVQFKTLGGQLTSIKDKDGLEYLWQADPEYWNGQAPILFPICGSLRNDWAIYRPQERPFLQV